MTQSAQSGRSGETEGTEGTGGSHPLTDDGTTLAEEGIRGYFQSQRAGLDAHLVERLTAFLDDAHDSIDCAIYDLRHPQILTALANAVARKVHVRIAYDASAERTGGTTGDPKPAGTQAALENAGLLPYATPVHERGRHLMHNKFVLRDQRDVWVGSANFTEGGLELQDNNCLTFSSRDLVTRFAAIFDDLVGPNHRHTRSRETLATVAASGVVVGSTPVLPLFAPSAGESIEQEIVAAINAAKKIRVMAFLLSDPGILQALAPFARDPRFDIRGVYDPQGMQDVLRFSHQPAALFWFMRDQRFVAAPSHAFSASHEQDFMHNKTFIVDDKLIFTGSYNFSENAEANDETMLRIESEPIAAAYTRYCETLFTTYSRSRETKPLSQPLTPSRMLPAMAQYAPSILPHPADPKPARSALDIAIRVVGLLIVAVILGLIAVVLFAGVIHF